MAETASAALELRLGAGERAHGETAMGIVKCPYFRQRPEDVIGVLPPIRRHVQVAIGLESRGQKFGESRLNEATLVVALLRPGVRKKHVNTGQRFRRDHLAHHFDGVMLDDPDVGKGQLVDLFHEGAHPGGVDFHPQKVDFRGLGGNYCRCLPHSEADFENSWSVSAENGRKIEDISRKRYAEPRHERFVGTLLTGRKAPLPKHKTANWPDCCIHASILRRRKRFTGDFVDAGKRHPHYRYMYSRRMLLPILAFALAGSPFAFAAENYVGLLRPAAKSSAIAIPEPGFYWPMAGPFGAGLSLEAPAEGFKLKLGYRYSRFFSVETGYSELGIPAIRAPFSEPNARGRGFSMETVGTLPLWRHAELYGKFGAWRSGGGASLLAGFEGAQRSGAGLRYGLGLKYDLSRRVGLQAEMERFSPLDRWGSREPDSDQVTLGVTWRF